MANLERLIIRINNPPQVPSHEDVLDTVKQYWDDVSSKYWSDTDTEIVEELGITKVALAELLDPTRHTFQYANIGGISSVRGYDHGDDWFVVMFSDGSRYLYTTKSTTPESLGFMRKYAIEGKGLNSYIMRVQRFNYAGRNVKGEILIKPGMEQFNPEGYKRLQLIKAFDMTTVSNEGILESVKKFFSLSNKGKGAELNKDKSLGHISMTLSSLRNTFASNQWMHKQTFNIGKINSKGISGVIDNKDILDTIHENDTFIESFKDWHKLVLKRTEEIREIAKDVGEGQELAASVAKLPKMKFTKKSPYKSVTAGEFNALNEATATKAAKAIVTQLKNITSCYHKDANILYFQVTKGYYGSDMFYDDKAFAEQYDEFKDRIFACLRWIDRSISGNISVGDISVEHFNTLISAAGPDGLDPIAKELLSINLSLVKAS